MEPRGVRAALSARPTITAVRRRLRLARRSAAGRSDERDVARAAVTDAHQRAALEVLREVAAGPIERGAAQLLIDDSPDAFYGVATCRLTPRNPAASPIEVHADWSGTYLHVGHGLELHELWQDDVEDRRRQLRACVAAVVAGAYEETYGPWKNGSLLAMTFRTPEGPVEVLHHGSPALADDRPFGRTTYEPYERDDDT